jgi:hypothetical protein
MKVELTIKFDGVDAADRELIEEKVQDLVDQLSDELGITGEVS